MSFQQPLVDTTPPDDLRPILTERLSRLQAKLKELEEEERSVTERVHDHRHDIQVIQNMIDVENRRIGDTTREPKNPDQRLLQMSLADIAEEFFQAGLTKVDILNRLQAIGYDFGDAKYPKRAVHGGWVGAVLRRKRNDEVADS